MTDQNDKDITKTISYGDTSNINVTQAYSTSSSPETPDKEISGPEQKTDRTETHNLGVGDRIELNSKSYEIVEVLVGDDVTGEAVIYKVRNNTGDDLVLKLYYKFVNPQDEPRPEPLSRIKTFNQQNILKLHDYGTGANKYQGKFCFEINEFARGGDLLSVPDIKSKYTIEFVEDNLLPQLLAGMITFHEAKIYHCDLKPQNVFYINSEQTKAVLADYGSAKTKDAESEKEIIKTTMVKGTDFYLAPEQARGVISEKNDYYSLGMILLHLLYPEKITTESLDRIIERQFAGRKIIEFSDDPEYQRLNLLIEGLTLQDIKDRWGSNEVERWQKAEDVEVTYPTSRDTIPIKLGNITIRTEQELLDYVQSNDNWFTILIDDPEGYHMLLTWLTSVQDFQRKKIFDRMIQYYLEDGERFVREALLRYFIPQTSVKLGPDEFNFFGEEKFTDISARFFEGLDKLWHTSELDDLKFNFFQFEFILGQVMGIAEANLRAQIRTFLDKIAIVFEIDPKIDYKDHQAALYTRFDDKHLALVLYDLKPDRQFIDHEGNELDSLEEAGLYFGRNEDRYKDRIQKEELRGLCVKTERQDLLNLSYERFLTTLFSDKVKYDIEITNVQQVRSNRGNLQISYKLGKSLAAFFRSRSIDKSFIEHGKRIETVVVNKGSKEFIAAITAKHKIDADAIDEQIKQNLDAALKKAKKSQGHVSGFSDSGNHLTALGFSFLKSVLFLLPVFCMLLIALATFSQQENIISLLRTITPFNLTLSVDFNTVKGFQLYGIHYLVLLSFIPLISMNFIEHIEIDPRIRTVYINLGLFLLLAPLISMMLTYLVIVSAPLWSIAISFFTKNSIEPNPDLLARIFYYTPWSVVILVNVLAAFAVRREFRFIPFIFALGVYFYFSLMLHDYELLDIPETSNTETTEVNDHDSDNSN